MREILDPVDPERLRPVFNDVFRSLQRGKALEPLIFHEGCYLLALDGTGYFSSPTVHCESCLEKVNRETGAVTYAHQLLGAVIVHPDRREVVPLARNRLSNRTARPRMTANATRPSGCCGKSVRSIPTCSSSWWRTALPTMPRTSVNCWA